MRLIDADVLSSDLESLETILSKEGWGLVKAVIDRIHLHKTVDMPQWVAVTERMPETYPAVAVPEYSEAVAVLMENYDVDTAIWTGHSWIMTHPTAHRPHAVTHWMLLPPPPDVVKIYEETTY